MPVELPQDLPENLTKILHTHVTAEETTAIGARSFYDVVAVRMLSAIKEGLPMGVSFADRQYIDWNGPRPEDETIETDLLTVLWQLVSSADNPMNDRVAVVVDGPGEEKNEIIVVFDAKSSAIQVSQRPRELRE